MSWNSLKAGIAAIIRANGNREITGTNMQNVLYAMVNGLGQNATFAGVATPSTVPGTPDGPVLYLTGQHGQYPNFGNIYFDTPNAIAALAWNGSTWVKTELVFRIDAPTTAQMRDLEGAVQNKADAVATQSNNLYNKEEFTHGSALAMPTSQYNIRTASNTVNYSMTPEIEIEGGESYYFGTCDTGSYNSYVFLDVNKAWLSGGSFSSANTLIAVAPVNAKYLRISYFDTNDRTDVIVAKSTVPVEYVPYGGVRKLSPTNLLSEEHIRQVIDAYEAQYGIDARIKAQTTFFMPKTLYSLKNRLSTGSSSSEQIEAEKARVLALDNLVVSRCKSMMYFDKTSSTPNHADSDEFIFFNGDTDAAFGQYNLKSVLSGETLFFFPGGCAHKTASPAAIVNPATEKTLLWIGDSYTESGSMIMEGYNILHNKLGLTNLRFIGARTAFNDTGAVDSDDNVQSIHHQGMAGRGIADFLKLNDSEGVAEGTHNPFLFNGELSVSQYMAGINEESLDYVIIELGINDVVGGGDTTAQVKQRMMDLLDLIHGEYPDAKIVIAGQVYLSPINSRAATSTNIGYYTNYYNSKVMALNSAYEEIAESASYSSFVTYADCGAMFRKELGWKSVQLPVLGTEETDKVIINKMHPGHAGYFMMAENITCCAAYTWFHTS